MGIIDVPLGVIRLGKTLTGIEKVEKIPQSHVKGEECKRDDEYKISVLVLMEDLNELLHSFTRLQVAAYDCFFL